MIKGSVAIKETAITGEVGSFLFIERKGVAVENCKLLSPVFGTVMALYKWLRANGWQALVDIPPGSHGRYGK
jgi:hypothetical protein